MKRTWAIHRDSSGDACCKKIQPIFTRHPRIPNGLHFYVHWPDWPSHPLLIHLSFSSPLSSPPACLTSFHGNKEKGENPNEFMVRSHKDEDAQHVIHISLFVSLRHTLASGMLFGMCGVVVNDKLARTDGWWDGVGC